MRLSRGFSAFLRVVIALFIREMKTRFGDSKLGYAWIVLEPMLHVVMLLIIFSVFRNRMMPQVPFSLFLITGLIPYFLFQHIAKSLMNSVSSNLALFSYRPVSPFAVYISRTILEVLIYITIFGILIAFFWWFNIVNVSIGFPLELMGALILIIFFGMVVGIVLSILIHKFENLKILVSVVFTLLYFLSGIMYPVWVLPEEYINFLEYNPLLHLIEIFRESFFSYYPHVEGINYGYPISFLLIVGYIGMWFYVKRAARLRSTT